MKKLAVVLLALLMLVSAAAADVPDKPKEFAYAYDFSGKVLSEKEMERIARYGEALSEATGAQAIAVVVDFLDGADPADYVTDIINTWGVGSDEENDGVVVLLARGDRKVQIGTGAGLDRVLTGSACGRLIDQNIEFFKESRFDEGVAALYEDVCEYVASAKGKKLSVGGNNGAGVVFDDRGSRKESSGGGLFDGLLGMIFLYIIVSVIFNAITPNGGGCFKWLLLGWLFGNRNDHKNRRPPMSGGFGGGRHIPRAPRSFGGGSSRGFGGGGRSFGGGSSRGFGGGSSRGGGGGRSF